MPAPRPWIRARRFALEWLFHRMSGWRTGGARGPRSPVACVAAAGCVGGCFPVHCGTGVQCLLRLVSHVAVVAALLPQAAPAFDDGADGVFEKRTSSHFVLLQDVDIDRASGWSGFVRFEKDVLEALESAYDAVDRYLGLRPRRRIRVEVYDPPVFDATFSGLFRFPAAGFYQGSIRVRGAQRFTGALERTLHHELVHAAFDAAAPSLALPGWVNEGVAEWFEARATGKRRLSSREYALLRQGARSGSLPSLMELSGTSFVGLDGPRAGLAYLTSYGAVDFLVRHHGERDLRRFCEELVRRRNLDRVLKRVFRTDLAELDHAFRRELSG